jgi:hypothetical protein
MTLFYEQGIEMLVLILALSKAAGTCPLLDIDRPGVCLRQMLKTGQTRGVLTRTALVPELTRLLTKLPDDPAPPRNWLLCSLPLDRPAHSEAL